MESRESPAHCFARAVAALKGAPVEHDPGDRKILTIVTSPGADTVISPDGLTVLWPFRRAPFSCSPELAAGVVASLRKLAPGANLDAPFLIDQDALSRVTFSPSGPRWVWVNSSAHRIAIACRVADACAQPPIEPEPLELWRPASKVNARFRRPRVCKHCRNAFDTFRLLDEAIVCHGCGRSEGIPRDELDAMILEIAGQPSVA